jgi:hypothetical protein
MAKTIAVTDIVDTDDIDYAVIEAAFAFSKVKAKVATALKARLKGLDVDEASDAYKGILSKVRGEVAYKELDTTRKGVYDCLKSARSAMRAKAKKAKAAEAKAEAEADKAEVLKAEAGKTGTTLKWVELQISALEKMVVTLQGDIDGLGVKDAPKAVAAAKAAIAAFKAAML